MGYNAVLDKVFSDEATTEPLSLEEFKRHLNMVFDSEGSYEFNDDDTYLGHTIIEARQMIEAYVQCSLISRTVTAIVRNDCGGIELPYGPVIEIQSIVDRDDVAITSYQVLGLQFKWLEYPCSCYSKLVYTAGYTTVPAQLVRAIKEQGAWLYVNRGDQKQEFANGTIALCQSAMEAAAPFKRTGFLV